MSNITDKPTLAIDDYRVDLHSRDFETPEQVDAEDAFRAKALRKQAADCRGWAIVVRKQRADRLQRRARRLECLADRLDPDISPLAPQTLASSRFMRDLRTRLLGAVWKLADDDQTGRLCRFDLAKPSWLVTPKQFRKEKPSRYTAKLRADLLRAARSIGKKGVADCDGFLLAFLHGEHIQYADGGEAFHPHFHVVATGDWIDVVGAMRGQRGYKRKSRKDPPPIRARRKIDDLAYALSYLLKGYWPGKWRGEVSGVGTERRSRQHFRIPEPHHSNLLLWLDHFEPADLILMMGVRLSRNGFTRTKNT